MGHYTAIKVDGDTCIKMDDAIVKQYSKCNFFNGAVLCVYKKDLVTDTSSRTFLEISEHSSDEELYDWVMQNENESEIVFSLESVNIDIKALKSCKHSTYVHQDVIHCAVKICLSNKDVFFLSPVVIQEYEKAYKEVDENAKQKRIAKISEFLRGWTINIKSVVAAVMCYDKHYTTMRVDIAKCEIVGYDSLCELEPNTVKMKYQLTTVLSLLNEIARVNKWYTYKRGSKDVIDFLNFEKKQQQCVRQNGVECGAHAFIFAENIFKGTEKEVTNPLWWQNKVMLELEARQRMVACILRQNYL